MIELLVVVSVVALLAALTLPAVERARDAARRTLCANNLRQLGIATQGYLSNYGVFPIISSFGGDHIGRNRDFYFPKRYSFVAGLLPGLDQRPLFDSINFDVAIDDFYIERITNPFVPGFEANTTAIATNLAALSCPDDTGGAGVPGRINYRANFGGDRWLFPGDGPFQESHRLCTAADQRDGFSQTVAYSEKLSGRPTASSVDPRTDMVFGGLGFPATPEESRRRCESPTEVHDGFIPSTGLCWLVGTLSQTQYNHIIEPNSPLPDCALPGVHAVSALVGARSNHPGGVNAAMVDASVRFVKNSIDRRVWVALGTRSGGEIIAPDQDY